MITKQHRQEALSRAYIQTVTAGAGMVYSTFQLDYGLDVSINHVTRRGGRRALSGYNLDIQAKSTTRRIEKEGRLIYRLEKKNYDDLIAKVSTPRILVLLVLSGREMDWLEEVDERLSIRGEAYWCSLRGFPSRPNKASVTVSIPGTNRFNRRTVWKLFAGLKRGKMP